MIKFEWQKNMLLEKCEHVLFFTGSMTSKALLILLVTEKKPLTRVFFLYTGIELRPTLDNVEWARKFCNSNNIEFERIKRKRLHSIIKDETIHYYIYVGLRPDEYYRVRKVQNQNVTKFYPLIERNINIKQCLEIIKRYENEQKSKKEFL